MTVLFAGIATTQGARAEMSEIHVAQQYGISYLPLMIMEEQKLIEKYAKAAGVTASVSWAKFAGGNVMVTHCFPTACNSRPEESRRF